MMAAGLRATAKAAEHPPEPKVGAPALDPTIICGNLNIARLDRSVSNGARKIE